MTGEFFKIQMAMIFDTFGQQNYPGPKVGQIWEAVKDLEADEFRKVVRHFIGNVPVKYPPQEKDFREQAAIMRSARFKKQNEEAKETMGRIAPELRSTKGLEEMKQKYGAKSVLELMQIAKRQGLGGES